MVDKKVAPEPVDFLIKIPLYEIFEYGDDELEKGLKLYQFSDSFDCFCPECGEHSIFQSYVYGNRVIHSQINYWINKGKFEVHAQCSRNANHKLYFIFEAKGATIQKIGQLPSLASLHMYDAKKYSNVIEHEYFREFTKAIGLATHGIGVGSYVYLRRIFESLIQDAHKKAQIVENWDEVKFHQSRMNEKIEMLASELPDFLVQNKNMYGILSKGIHELTEQECLKAFPVVKLGIELILDERIVLKEKQRKVEAAQKAIQMLAGKV